MDENLKREIILEHYKNPLNRGLIDDDSYLKENTNNTSCIDEIDLMVKVEDNKIKDIRFDGEACAICTSSTSLMIESLIGKDINEVKEILTNYLNMIDNKEYDKELLGTLNVYSDIAMQPNRKKCALLPWWGIEKILNKLNN